MLFLKSFRKNLKFCEVQPTLYGVCESVVGAVKFDFLFFPVINIYFFKIFFDSGHVHYDIVRYGNFILFHYIVVVFIFNI